MRKRKTVPVGFEFNNFKVVGEGYHNESYHIVYPVECDCGATYEMTYTVIMDKARKASIACKACRGQKYKGVPMRHRVKKIGDPWKPVPEMGKAFLKMKL